MRTLLTLAVLAAAPLAVGCGGKVRPAPTDPPPMVITTGKNGWHSVSLPGLPPPKPRS